ncbi:hypothetical protein K2X96_00690 [Patescibacteria group bacterium]|nr:hypothetical protein [Patescibacteria group bacterium]
MVPSLFQVPITVSQFYFDLMVVVDDPLDFDFERLKVFHAARCRVIPPDNLPLPHLLVVCPVSIPPPRVWKLNSLRMQVREPTSYVVLGKSDQKPCPLYEHLKPLFPSVLPEHTLWTEPVQA